MLVHRNDDRTHQSGGTPAVSGPNDKRVGRDLDQTWAQFMGCRQRLEEELGLSSSFEGQLADCAALMSNGANTNQRVLKHWTFWIRQTWSPNCNNFGSDHYAVEGSMWPVWILNGQPFDGETTRTTCNFGHWLASYTTKNSDFNRLLADVRASLIPFYHTVIDIRQDRARYQSTRITAAVHRRHATGRWTVFAIFYEMIKVAEAGCLACAMT